MRVFLKPVLTTAAAVLLSLCFAVTSRSQSMPGYQAPDKPKRADDVSVAVKAKRGEVPLSKLYGHLKADPSKTKRLPPIKPRDRRPRLEKRLQVGVVRTLPSPLNPLIDSVSYNVAEGEVRVASIVSEGALYTRIQFKEFSLPAGARVFVYPAGKPDEFFGPYEGKGPWNDGLFWTPAISGDQIIIEYTAPTGTITTDTPFKISEIAHIYKNVATNDPAGVCNLEVPAEWANVAKSVGMLQFITGGLVAQCTGTLLNDSDTSTNHYVLTANHCISSQSEAQSLTVYWNYITGDTPPGGTPTTNGSNLMVTGTASDFTLLRLTGSLPGGLFFSGWDATTVSAGTPVTGIHHPEGSHKRIAFGTTNANCASGLPGPCQNFTGVTWNQGTTEPGSSGSGLWKGSSANPVLIGTLTGGEASCDTPTQSDYYGRFSVTYPSVASFLEGTNCVTSLSPTNQNFGNGGGSGSFNVNAPGGCNWTAVTSDSWITITPPATGSGNGSISFTVQANSGPQRYDSIVVGGQVFSISQDGGGACAATPISFGQTINGTLSINDCPLDDGSFYDVYSFSATAGTQVSVSMQSSAFDTFLFLNNPDGSVLALDDDGGGGTNSRIGFITLPTTGTYTIFANSFWTPGDPQGDGGVGAYSLTLTERPKVTLTANSTPASGVAITVTPNDLNGNGDGSTQFTRTYYQNTTVVLNAPGLANGNEFKEWQKDGVTVPNSVNVITVNMDANHTMTAVYGPITTYNFTFKSSNPDSGVPITISPNDNNGAGNGTTTFTRNYNRGSNVFLTAPQNAPNGNLFQKWQRDDGYSETSRFISTGAFANSTWTAVYVAPLTFTMTVSAQNPSSGINITVTPNDNNGSSDGAAPFTRTYYQGTNVTLTAPASAPNGNVFDRWVDSIGGNASFSHIFSFFMDTNKTFTAVYATKPFVWLESGTSNAIALNSVTFLRGPFQILDPHNFSFDGHTRIVLFTSAAGITQADQNDPTAWVVTAQTLTFPTSGWTLPVEAVGPYAGGELTGSYIVVKLPNGLPTQQLELRVRLRQTTSDASYITIAP